MSTKDERTFKYIVNAAIFSKDSRFHRIMSLRKVITKDKNYITKDVFDALMRSAHLTKIQKDILSEAMKNDSSVYREITSLDEKSKLDKTSEILRRKKRERKNVLFRKIE